MISRHLYRECFEGYVIIDCAVRERLAFSFLLSQLQDEGEETEPNKRLVTYFLDDEDVGWGGVFWFPLVEDRRCTKALGTNSAGFLRLCRCRLGKWSK